MRLHGGLSLLELTMVVSLLLILSAAVFPLVDRQLLKSVLNAELQKVLFDIRQAQQFSLTREEDHEYYGIQFFDNLPVGSGRGYKILRYEPSATILPIAGSAAATIIKSPLAEDNPMIIEQNLVFDRRVRFDAESELGPGGTNNRIIFTAVGSATSDGQSLLGTGSNEVVLVCGNGNLSGRIAVSPLTGDAQLQ